MRGTGTTGLTDTMGLYLYGRSGESLRTIDPWHGHDSTPGGTGRPQTFEVNVSRSGVRFGVRGYVSGLGFTFRVWSVGSGFTVWCRGVSIYGAEEVGFN